MLALGGAACLLAACGTLSGWEANAPDSVQAMQGLPLAAAVDALAAPQVAEGRTPGLMIGLLLPDGSRRFFGYGTTEQGGGERPGPDTLFATGSLSKGFLAAVTATLVAEGSLAWSDRLSSLLPPEVPLSPDAAAISVEQLATHTSGLPRQFTSARTLAYFVQYLFTGDNFYRHFDRDSLLAGLADFEAPTPLEPRYSNIGYGILGDILERRTGLTVDSLLARRITGPLGLAHTGYDPESLPGFAARARGHAGDQPKFIRRGQPVPDWHMTDIMRGSAALYSSAADLLSFAAAHLDPAASPLTAALAGNLRVRYPRAREAAAVAWIVDEVGNIRITYQVGLIAGYTSYLAVNPANHTAVVVLQNAFNWDYSLGHQLMLLLNSAERQPV